MESRERVASSVENYENTEVTTCVAACWKTTYASLFVCHVLYYSIGRGDAVRVVPIPPLARKVVYVARTARTTVVARRTQHQAVGCILIRILQLELLHVCI